MLYIYDDYGKCEDDYVDGDDMELARGKCLRLISGFPFHLFGFFYIIVLSNSDAIILGQELNSLTLLNESIGGDGNAKNIYDDDDEDSDSDDRLSLMMHLIMKTMKKDGDGHNKLNAYICMQSGT